jgi:eukaryotic-like serine/threonine-protein kinase
MGAPGSIVLGRYALGEKIGAGGFSEVWRATDVVLARPVAIKMLHLTSAEALTRFRAEAQQQGGGARQGGASHGKAQGQHTHNPADGATVD